MVNERGLDVNHTTVFRYPTALWTPVLKNAADLTYDPPMTQARVDETYVKVKGKWKYLYRAVD